MNYKKTVLFVLGLLVSFSGLSQVPKERNQENINVNKFRQLYQEFSSPNMLELLLVHQVQHIINNKPITKWILNWMMKIRGYMALKL